MTLLEVLNGRRPMKLASFMIGLPLALFLVLYPTHKDWPAVAGVVIPFSAVIGIEYVLRIFEWSFYRVRNRLF